MPQLSSEHVFMSYSRRDDIVMHRIVSFLRKQGIQVWVDNEKLTPGTPIWEVEIEKAIKNASAIIVLLSPDSKDSEWVRREISLGDQYKKRVFPVLIRGDHESSISLRLINRQFVDLRNNEKAGLASLQAALSVYIQELSSLEQNSNTENQNLTGKKYGQAATREVNDGSESKIKEIVSDRLPNKKSSFKQNTQEVNLKHKNDNISPPEKGSPGILWVTFGWTIGGLFGGFLYSYFGEIAGWIIGGAIGGAIGGIVTVMGLRADKVLPSENNILKPTLAWAIGGAIGWAIGWGLTEAIGAGIGMAIFAIIGLASTMGLDYLLNHWKNILVITLVWAIGEAIGWSLARGLIDELGIDYATSWAIGTAIGWSIGAFFMIWQLASESRKNYGNS